MKNLLLLALPFFCISNIYAKEMTLKAPKGSLTCIVQTDRNGHLSYSIEFNKQKVVLPSTIGIIVDNDDLGSAATLGKPKTKTLNETYPTRGVHSIAKNNYREAIIPLTGGKNKTAWTLEVRVFPDAVAYRYRVPGNGKRRIAGESSSWQMIGGTAMWYQTTNKKDYEMPFFTMMPDTVSRPFEIMTTSTFKLPNGLGYAKISEANLIKYSDMALETTGKGYFKPLFHNSIQGWENEGEILSPWRMVIVTPDLNSLVNTDVFHNLCPAPLPELIHAEWIRPGKSTWAWMVTGSPALKDQKKWIDWTEKLEFEYYLIDDGWAKWNDDGKDQWQCMKELVDYAKTKNVSLWAWVRTSDVKTKEQRKAYFDNAKAVGLAGLKIDFMGPANPEWVQWYDDVLREIAEYRLMVNFHGANKPTGRERTYPHEMTREGIRGREMGKQPALHDASLPFTRFIHGHADYTPTDFRADKLKGSTWAHELAMAVIFTSPMFVMAGDPVTYIESDAFDFIKTLPAEWDETIVLPDSEIGNLAVFARRKGNEWYIGIINREATSITIKTGFLQKGEYSIEEFRDIVGKTDAWQHTVYSIDKNSTIEIPLNRDGGYVATIHKIK